MADTKSVTMRYPVDLLRRVDEVRGDVPRARFVFRALERVVEVRGALALEEALASEPALRPPRSDVDFARQVYGAPVSSQPMSPVGRSPARAWNRQVVSSADAKRGVKGR